MDMFRVAYRVVRDNSNEIYKGFGFHHLSDATQYYVHPNNESYDKRTVLCQPIGEAVILFTLMLQNMKGPDSFGDYYTDTLLNRIVLDINVPADYRENGVVEEIFHYRALSSGENLVVAAYDENGNFLPGNMDHLHPRYKLLPAFMVLLAREMEENADFRTLMEKFIAQPAVDTFVNVHEDFYQNHKREEYELHYEDLGDIKTDGMVSHAGSVPGREDSGKKRFSIKPVKIDSFPEGTFPREEEAFIPRLPKEFVLPRSLSGVCNALEAGDLLSVLLHGPAGTGKTMSCKLICQAVGLPLMATINCTENLDEFVLGKYIPQDDRIVFRESAVTEAIRSGGAVAFEEINFARPQYLSFLNSLLDDNGFVRLDNGEVVRRNPNFRFFATMNRGYFGTRELNQALYNRFSCIIEIASLSDEAVSRMLLTRVPECRPVLQKILGVYHKLKHKIEQEELDVVISPRNLENWARLAKYEGYIRAAEKTIIPVARGDRALEEAFRGVIRLYRWKE